MKKYIIVLGLSILLSGVVGYATSETRFYAVYGGKDTKITEHKYYNHDDGRCVFTKQELNYPYMILTFLMAYGASILLVSINGKWITNNLAHAKRSLTKNS
jgi:hypothetical protein